MRPSGVSVEADGAVPVARARLDRGRVGPGPAPPVPSGKAGPGGRPKRHIGIWHRVRAHRWFVLSVLALVGFGSWYAARVLLGPEVVVDRVARADLVETVVASGHVETPFRVEIGSQIVGTVAEVLVEDGQRVTRGQPLVEIEASELKSAVVQAEGAVAQAEARLRQLRELTLPAAQQTLAQARATLVDAQRTFERTDALARNGNATRVALDEAQRNLEIARTQARVGELQVYTARPGGSDYVLAETQLGQARASLAAARSRLSYATVVAPRDGVLIARNVERGAVVQPGKALIVLAPSGTTQVVIQVDERNLGRLKLGQKALVSADAYPKQTFGAEIAYVNPGVDIARASVEVKLNVPDPPEYLVQDMTVSVDIEIARRDDALVLPLRDIFDAMSGSPWAMLVTADRRVRRQPLRLGLRGSTDGEVLDGVAEGDLVIPGAAGIRIGQRVRPVAP